MSQEIPDISSYRKFVAAYRAFLRQPLLPPDIRAPALSTALPQRNPARPCALLITPHPDDEGLTGALPLRLLHEQNWQIINVAATLGSDKARREERKNELAKACAVLGFDCVLSAEDGFSDVSTEARDAAPKAWNEKVERIQEIIARVKPNALFFPHAHDGHATHIGAHWLGKDALARMPRDFSCAVIQTEYWQPLPSPNLMVGIGENDVATLLAALSCHAGEVMRNAYDKRFPAFLIDAVRRCENVVGKGKNPPPMDFAEIYSYGVWVKGTYIPSALNRFLSEDKNPESLFE